MNKIDVIILCGGVGSRINEIVIDRPKILIEISGKTILERQLEMISCLPKSRIILATHYYAKKIENYCKNNGANYIYHASSSKELGTAGALIDVINRFGQFTKTVMVINGDILTNVNLKDIVRNFHDYMDCLMVTTFSSEASEFGLVTVDNNNKILEFVEKKSDIMTGRINAGIYLFSSRFLNELRSEKIHSLENEVFPKMNKLFCFNFSGLWFDVGTPKRYLLANSCLSQINQMKSATSPLSNR